VPKAFVACAGRELWEWSADVLARVCDAVVLIVPLGREEPHGSELRIVGGASRSESVRNGLAGAPAETEIVVVHDAARPLLTADVAERCIAEVRAGADAAIAAARVKDTVKEADGDLRVVRTLDRSRLWAIQTPQVFRADLLRRVLDAADPATLAAATDDAALVEAAGGAVRLVESPSRNFKVTDLDDLKLAEALLC
jgi:2-C-methyl-D-erythritol 4-phosphate cytidylyltransferase